MAAILFSYLVEKQCQPTLLSLIHAHFVMYLQFFLNQSDVVCAGLCGKSAMVAILFFRIQFKNNTNLPYGPLYMPKKLCWYLKFFSYRSDAVCAEFCGKSAVAAILSFIFDWKPIPTYLIVLYACLKQFVTISLKFVELSIRCPLSRVLWKIGDGGHFVFIFAWKVMPIYLIVPYTCLKNVEMISPVF